MDNLTDRGREALEAAAARQGFGLDAARAMLDALVAGRGGQAQFSHPELGGMGQWSRGGMTMIGDMFNNGLKYRVDALASDLAPLATDPGAFVAAPAGGPRGGADWWPEGLGAPSSVGAQNAMRYAVFPTSRRLAVDRGGRVTVYDTGDHLIGGASQQQGGGQTLTFSSQFGTIGLEELPVAEDAHAAPARPAPEAAPSRSAAVEPQAASVPNPAPNPTPAATPAPAPAAVPAGDPLALIERLADLRGKGVITEEEFAAKKAELLARL